MGGCVFWGIIPWGMKKGFPVVSVVKARISVLGVLAQISKNNQQQHIDSGQGEALKNARDSVY